MFAARIVKRPGYVLGVLVLLIAAWCTIAFPDSADAATAAVDAKKVKVYKLQNYKPKLQRGQLRYINPNTFPIKIISINDNSKRLPDFTVAAGGTVIKRYKTDEVTYSIFALIDGTEENIQTGTKVLRR